MKELDKLVFSNNLIDRPYDNNICDECEWCTIDFKCIKHTNMNEYADCEDIEECSYFE